MTHPHLEDISKRFECRKCGKVKNPIEFPWRKDNQAYRRVCKKCDTLRANSNRKLRGTEVKEYYRKRYAKNKEKMLAYVKARKIKSHVIANRKLNQAILSGNLVRKPCEVCGKKKAHGHHFDYRRPLSVWWLCRLHHNQLHGKYLSKDILDIIRKKHEQKQL